MSSTKFIYTTNFDEVDMQDTLPGASTVMLSHNNTHTNLCDRHTEQLLSQVVI